MTLPVTSYATTDEVRACIGVTDNEMPDDMLMDMSLGLSIIADMEVWLDDHAARWTAYKGGSPTSQAILIGRHIQLYCQWAGAYFASLAYLAIPHQITDGKAAMSRFSKDDASRIKKLAAGMRDKSRSAIQVSLGTDTAAASVMGSASPLFDPVTGVTS